MKYMGSKNRIAKHILPIMLKEMEEKGHNMGGTICRWWRHD